MEYYTELTSSKPKSYVGPHTLIHASFSHYLLNTMEIALGTKPKIRPQKVASFLGMSLLEIS